MLFSYAIFSKKYAQRHDTTVADNEKVKGRRVIALA
jgi:hypothetical protein